MVKKKEKESQIDRSHKAFLTTVKKLEHVEIVPVNELGNPSPNKSGSASLDFQLHLPFAGGNQHEIYGNPGTGKTTVALSILGYAQRSGRHVAYVNEEGTLNRSLIDTISSIDVNHKDENGDPTFHIINTPYAERSMEAVRAFVQQPGAVVAVDSVDSMVPQKIAESDFSDQHMGDLGKLLSRVCRDFAKILPRSGATIIWLNQIRDKITTYGDPTTTPGGWAIPFYANQRVWLKNVKKDLYIKGDDGEIIGMHVPYYIKKNKCVPGFLSGHVPIKFGYGIWEAYDIVDVATQVGILPPPDRGRILPPKELSQFDPPFKCDGETTIFVKHLIPFLDGSNTARAYMVSKVREMVGG